MHFDAVAQAQLVLQSAQVGELLGEGLNVGALQMQLHG
jgi:hypothetical protein